MKRFEGNPILEPIGSHPWESRAVFNAGIFQSDGKIHMLYRAMGADNISRLGYAVSFDGYNIDYRSPEPVFSPESREERDGCEDPRITLMDEALIMAYTAFGKYAYEQVYQIGIAVTTIDEFFKNHWQGSIRKLAFPGIENKNALVFPKKIGGEYLMFHRLGLDVCLAKSANLSDWHGLKFVMGPRQFGWDSWKVGTTGLPIELNEGWLFIYHGVSNSKIYSIGTALLDRNYPEYVIYRCQEPILKPEMPYERFGKVPNVIYSCGNAQVDGKVLIYYGGADSVLAVASFDLAELLPKK
jgi:predicted GH43/DUF377 family glycosyl hydrolase